MEGKGREVVREGGREGGGDREGVSGVRYDDDTESKGSRHTDIYDRVPTNELAIESISCPLTPKSHILISPREFTRMFDGFTSETNTHQVSAPLLHILGKLVLIILLSYQSHN